MSKIPKLDHTVINTRFEMDEAVTAFEALGFQLTPRGYHSLGSINHLMMFGHDYLELIGLPADNAEAAASRPDVANAPVGINGLVFKSDNVDETRAHMMPLGMASDPVKAFHRPVDLAEGSRNATFRTVHVRGDIFPGGRVYFCEHDTPDLVWRPEWQSHPNGVESIAEFVIVAEDHARQAADIARLIHSDVAGSGGSLSVTLDGAAITVMTPYDYRQRYGDLASRTAGRSSIFGAIVFRTSDIEAVRAIAAGQAAQDNGDSIAIRQDDFDAVLEFIG